MVPEAETTQETQPPFQGEIDPANTVVSPQSKQAAGLPEHVEPLGGPGDPRAPSQLGFDTPQYGTETPYRKTPPTNMGSIAEAGMTSTPPTTAGISQASAAAAATPQCTAAPAVTGTPTNGQTLSCSNGTWSPAATSYGYQWYRYPDTAIVGATAATRVLAAADVGKRIFCRVTGKTTAGGSSPRDSNIVGPVA